MSDSLGLLGLTLAIAAILQSVIHRYRDAIRKTPHDPDCLWWRRELRVVTICDVVLIALAVILLWQMLSDYAAWAVCWLVPFSYWVWTFVVTLSLLGGLYCFVAIKDFISSWPKFNRYKKQKSGKELTGVKASIVLPEEISDAQAADIKTWLNTQVDGWN